MSGFEQPFVTTSAASSSRAPQATASSHRAWTGGVQQATPPPSEQDAASVRRESSLEAGRTRSSSSGARSPAPASTAASPHAAALHEEEWWVADNSLLGADSPGIAYRRTQSVSDVADDEMLAWGEAVRGHPVGGGGAWLQAGDRFLPMELNGVTVLQRQEAATASLAALAAAATATATALAAAAWLIPWRQSEAPSEWVSRKQQVAKPRLDDSSVRYGQVHHRGATRGEHVKQHYYKYLGEGPGGFETQELPRGGRGGFAEHWWLLIPLGCCCGWVPLLALIRSGMKSSAAVSSAAAPSAEPEFDCDLGYSRAQDEYSSVDVDARRWCCDHYDRGCRHSPAEPRDAEGYDCSKGIDRWREAWSPDKQSWCCEREGRGCPATTTSTTEYQYNCSDVAPGCLECMEAEWPEEKAEWCCLRRGLGCGVLQPQNVEFDCQAGYDHWRTGWSPEKKDYCCNIANLACNESAADEALDAASMGPDHDQGVVGAKTAATTTFEVGSRTCKDFAGWPQSVGNAYCGTCRHLVRMGAFTNCDDYCQSFGQLCFRAAQDNSAKVGQSACEVQAQVGCGDTMDLDELASDNSSLELVCGCEDPGPPRTPAPTPSSVECKSFLAWPNKEGAGDCGNCKHLVHIGAFLTCEAYCDSFGQQCWYGAVNDNTPVMDGEPGCKAIQDVACSENMARFHDNSEASMICGCQYPEGVEGRTTAQYTWTSTSTSTMWYDCSVGPWPATKSSWCCENEQIGCGEYECDSGPWPQKKRDWCCKSMQKGCETDGYFDCRQGPWPSKKRNWCCQNEGMMCPETQLYSCEAGPWPPAKRKWCCETESKGCEEAV